MSDIEQTETVTYICEPCGEQVVCSNQEWADLYKNVHLSSKAHFSVVMPIIMQNFVDKLKPELEHLAALAETMNAPPKNTPRDPSMRKDKRKWGGR